MCSFFDANSTVFHLAAIAFQPDWAGGRQFKSAFKHLSVARAVSLGSLDFNDQFIPILRLVFLELFIGSGNKVIAALQLRLPNEYSAVRIWGCAKLQL